MTRQAVSDHHIRAVAQKCREAIERTDPANLPVTLRNFPNGSCGDVALLLGTHLIDSGFGEFQYVLGERGRGNENTWTSHAWIEMHDLVVDITADQFPDAPEAVIVERNSVWHQQFNGEIKHEAHLRVYGEQVADLYNAYQRLFK